MRKTSREEGRQRGAKGEERSRRRKEDEQEELEGEIEDEEALGEKFVLYKILNLDRKATAEQIVVFM